MYHYPYFTLLQIISCQSVNAGAVENLKPYVSSIWLVCLPVQYAQNKAIVDFIYICILC